MVSHMNILNSVLKEEFNRLKKLNRQYLEQISNLPKGSLIRKKIKGHIYYYLSIWQENKSALKYIGKLSVKERENLLDKIDERRKLERLRRQVKENIKKLEKIIK